ncbi:TetR/AcrR family transcriptional regulator [Actinoplanes sp. NPDC051494]|uniref:TetR/AcrR family transcriptional regulator n=1 Tax=Actinoplanes sp. NPDC051494 TaxID=3363907 RepID=UPI0037882F43
MARVSQAQAQANRQRVVETAARLFRERGVQGVSVADLMAAAGLTHGGFYKRFASKEALVAEAVGDAYAGMAGRLHGADARHPGDHDAARRELLDYYLSPAHRDDPGNGCPTTGFGPDVAREGPDSPAREPFARGVEDFARWLGPDDSDEDPDHTGEDPGATDEDLVTLATMVGALLLSRATTGTDLSQRILTAARTALGPDR